MMKKTCKCGKLINYNEKCCSECAKEHKQDTAYYDRYKRDKDSYSFYRSKAWLNIRVVVMARYNGLCLYSLYVKGRLIPADVVHHIVELNKDKGKALDMGNLIPLSNAVHSKLHTNYTHEDEILLRNLIKKWEKEQS